MAFLSEARLESVLLEQMTGLGYATASDELIGPDGAAPERKAYDEAVFHSRLAAAVAKLNPHLPAEVLQELIKLARDIRAARSRGEEQGLSEEEIAFYDALAENESAVQMMGNEKLRVIAHELLVSLRGNVSVDWAHWEPARACACWSDAS